MELKTSRGLLTALDCLPLQSSQSPGRTTTHQVVLWKTKAPPVICLFCFWPMFLERQQWQSFPNMTEVLGLQWYCQWPWPEGLLAEGKRVKPRPPQADIPHFFRHTFKLSESFKYLLLPQSFTSTDQFSARLKSLSSYCPSGKAITGLTRWLDWESAANILEAALLFLQFLYQWNNCKENRWHLNYFMSKLSKVTK